MRLLDQLRLDRERITYRVTFPVDMTEDGVIAWLHAASGAMKPASRFVGAPAMGFEVWSTNEGIVHRLRVPSKEAGYIISQLQGLVPGVHVLKEPEPPQADWTDMVELGLTHSSRTLNIPSIPNMAVSLLHSISPVYKNEVVMLQWVVTPALPQHKPIHREAQSDIISPRFLTHGNLANRDEVNDRRSKLEAPNFMAVLRVGVRAGAPVRAGELIKQVKSSLDSTRGPATKFVRKAAFKRELQARIDRAAGSVHYPAQLSVPELAALISWPVNGLSVPGLTRPSGRRFPPSGSIPTEGVVIGDSVFPGSERPIAIGYDELGMHTQIIGKTGTGKSVLAMHMGRQIMAAGHGLIAIETEGNLYEALLNCVPKDRIGDVYLMDVQDTRFPVGFNPLDQGDPRSAVDDIMELLEFRFGRQGIWAPEYIQNGLLTLAEQPGLSFIDIVPLLSPMTSDEVAWADAVSRSARDPELKRWWQKHSNNGKLDQQKRVDPVMSRLMQLTTRRELRNIVGQSKSTFQISDILSGNKILLVNFKGIPGRTASLMCTLLMNTIWRQAKSVAKDRPTFLMLDEFADFVELPIGVESMLAQARKHKLPMILAHQHLSQLPTGMQDAIISNTRNKVIFQGNNDDGNKLSRELGRGVAAADITGLQTYQAIASVLTPSGTAAPVTIVSRDKTRGPAWPATSTARTARTTGGRSARSSRRWRSAAGLPSRSSPAGGPGSPNRTTTG